MKILLDTNVIFELVARNPTARVVTWLDELDASTVYLSVLTIGEIRKGIEKLSPSKRRDALSAWLETDLLLRFEGRMVFVPEGQHDSSQAGSAWNYEENSPVPAGRLNRSQLRLD